MKFFANRKLAIRIGIITTTLIFAGTPVPLLDYDDFYPWGK